MKKNIYIITLMILIIDQFVKGIILQSIATLKTVDIIPHFFFFTNVKNTGGAWSLFDSYPYLLTIIGFACIIILNQYLLKKNQYTKLETVYFGLIMGGMLGNFLDRVIREGVVDFIGFRFGSYQFPIFNIADIAIVIGFGIILFEIIRGEINDYRSKQR